MSRTSRQVQGLPVPGPCALRLEVVPPQVCSFSCIHCAHGRTLQRTLDRAVWETPEALVARVERRFLASRRARDVCEFALAGGGEPTLHARLGEVIERLRGLGLPVTVHTNGSLLWRPDVQQDLARADRVVLSVCAGEPRLFEYVRRPVPGLGFDRIVEGWSSFRRGYPGRLEVEVVVLGITAVDEDVRKTASAVGGLKPDRVTLRTCAGVTAEPYAFPVQDEALERFSPFFAPRAHLASSLPPCSPETLP